MSRSRIYTQTHNIYRRCLQQPICTKHVLSGKEWGEVRCQTLTIYTGFLFEIITTSTEKAANVDMYEHPNDLNLDFEIKTTL